MPAAASTSASSAEASAWREPVERPPLAYRPAPGRLERPGPRAHFVSWARMSRLPILLACLFLAVFAAACGDDSEDEASAPQETATATAEPETGRRGRPRRASART